MFNRDVRIHIRETAFLAYPVSVGYFGFIMLGVTDSLMVGKLGAAPLAAASLVVHVFNLTMVIALGMAFAITPIVAHADGEGDTHTARETLRHGLFLNIFAGVLLVGAQMLIADALPYLGQDPEVSALAAPYLRILGMSFVPFMVTMTFKNFIEGLSFTKPGMYIVLSANLLNVFGNWVFIHGNLGMPAFGLNGAGMATFFNEVYMAVAFTWYVSKSPKFKKYKPLITMNRIHWKLINRLVKVGLPTGVHYFFESGSISVYAIMIGWLGAQYLAAHQVALSMAAISFMLVFGIGAAATIRIGNALGRREPQNARRAGFIALALGMTMMTVFGAIFIGLRDILPGLYVDDPVVIATASTLLLVAAFFQIADGLQAVGLGALRGLEDTRTPMKIAFVAYWIVGIPIGYILGFPFGYGAIGVWGGLLVSLSIAAAAFVLRFHKLTKRLLA